ncbi:MAG: chemotaxis response regulator protein-glutamate methylesterase [Spirochaetales bacterium]|nr:chemotaxis response regulator protein-glutamate methylesterase [Spirochaetales bacterium]
MKEISVMICDDSALMRNLIGRIIEEADGLVLAGKAMNGKFLLDKIPRLKPDIILLDLEMPEMNGIEFLKERKKLNIDIPVVILSSIAVRGARVTMDALSLGASDFILKPSGSISEDIHVVRDRIVATLLAYGKKSNNVSIPLSTGTKQYKSSVPDKQKSKIVTPVPSSIPREKGGNIDIVAIGISTGGPNALRVVLADIDPDFPVPIVIVQHMPAGFTTEFAKSLDRICPLNVKEVTDGDVLESGKVFIAPGNFHIEVVKKKLATLIRTSSADLVNGHRPSADVLFSSVAKHYGGNSLAVIMTGMGRDGASEIGTIYAKGGITVGQDEASSIVYGMPKVAAERGFVEHVVSVNNMAATLNKFVKEKR